MIWLFHWYWDAFLLSIALQGVTIERFMLARAAVYGASSVERLSVEKAIAEQVRRFKSIRR